MNDKKRLIFYSIFQLFICQIVFSQETSGLSSSPYSLYGLGLSNELNSGKSNTLGKTGIAMPTEHSINNLNPASLGSIPKGSFLFDIGLKLQQESLYENGIQEYRFNGNFSSMGIAFPVSEKSGLGIILLPYTNVGYSVLGIENPIDGSTNTFFTDIVGSGGLNDIQLNYGYSVTEKIRLGLKGSFLFGNIKENENDIIGSSILNITEENKYNNFRFGAGLQYDINDNISMGSIINFPTNLNGNQTRTITINVDEPNEEENNLEDFKLPLEVGFGLHAKLNEKLFFNLDYKRSFWNATNQSDLVGDYVDQDFFGVGAEYIPNKRGFNYWEKMNYRAGFNFNSGNLSIDDTRINNFEFDLGIGIPASKRTGSMINIGYAYGQKGQVTNGLIKEKLHTITLNFSLEDIWFIKKKIQ